MKRKRNKVDKFNILLGITGGIAAYKCCELIRLFSKEGHDVTVILTKHAKKFVTPLTLETLSGNPVYTDLFKKGSFSTEHINLSKWGDVLLVAPATANMIGKFASGIADDLLSTMLLAFKGPIMIAPSMHSEMWDNAIVRQNIEKLKGLGIHIVPPEEGELASGDVGKGRLPEPRHIMDHTTSVMTKKKDLEGKKVLITAGPTQEYIDPVRFISSPSSGKMGIALAKEAHERGAKVTLIHGPIKTDGKFSWKTIPVTSAAEMNRAVQRNSDCDIFISSAAVGDFSPVKAPQKIKKNGNYLDLKLRQSPDILLNFSKNHGKGKIVVGFAAETSDAEKSAYQKLKQKKLDLIIANDVTIKDSGFGSEFNAVSIIDKKGHAEKLPLQEKSNIAKLVFDRIKRIRK